MSTTIEKSCVKNAPLLTSEDRSDFVSWATSVPDGSMSAGWQPLYPRLADDLPAHVRLSLAKLVEFSRRKLGLSPEQLAEKSGVELADILSLENSQPSRPSVLTNLAPILGVSVQALLELAGFSANRNAQRMDAAVRFAARTAPSAELSPTEIAELDQFEKELSSAK